MKEHIDYIVKKNMRARNVTLRITPGNSLVVVVPRFFNEKKIPEILDEHKKWIDKCLSEVKKKKFNDVLPSEIKLNGLSELWKIKYVHNIKKRIQIVDLHTQSLMLTGNINDTALCQKKLIMWIKNKSHQLLVSILEKNRLTTNLTYKKLIIRSQKTRWGSCNSKKLISLNYKLVFLPLELVTHVVLHELAHTVHLNHSKEFWQLLASFDQNYLQHRKDLHLVNKNNYIPSWIN